MSIEQGWEDADDSQEQSAESWFPQPIPVKIQRDETENVAPGSASWMSYQVASAAQIGGGGGIRPTQLCTHKYHRYKAKFLSSIPAGITVYLANSENALMGGSFGFAYAVGAGQNIPEYDAQQPLYAVYTGTATGSQSVTASASFAATAGATATLPAGASISGFDIGTSEAAGANTITVTVTGVAGGTLTYELAGNGNSAEQLSIRYPVPLQPANPAVGIAVTTTGGAATPAGTIDAYGFAVPAAGSAGTVPVISVLDESFKTVQ